MKPLVMGIDFDNTIVCYDELFYRVAIEQNLIPLETPKSKDSIRGYLRSINQEETWIALQGYVYGCRMNEASVYPGVAEFMTSLIKQKIPVYIISHKTRYPYRGPSYDLHKAAYEWLETQQFFNKEQIGLDLQSVFFETTANEKINRIIDKQCTYFVDDLPEFLLKENFPASVRKFLFCPHASTVNHHPISDYQVFKNWQEISRYILKTEYACCS